MTFPLALTWVSVRTQIGSGTSFAMRKMTLPFEQHIKNLGFSRVDGSTPYSFQ